MTLAVRNATNTETVPVMILGEYLILGKTFSQSDLRTRKNCCVNKL